MCMAGAVIRKRNRASQVLGGYGKVRGGKEEVLGQGGRPWGQKGVQHGEMETTLDPGKGVIPERDLWNPLPRT